MEGIMETRREISEADNPICWSWAARGVKVLSTLDEEKRVPGDCSGGVGLGDADAGEEGADGVGLSGDLRWARCLEALQACARVRPQLAMR
jgi:hypothetical protein